jgi:hypothetical protein
VATNITNPQLLSGARGLVSYKDPNGNAVVLGIATDITINIRQAVRDSFVMGRPNAATLDPTAIDVDCSIGRLVPVNTMTNNTQPSAGQHVAGNGVGAATAIELGLEDLIVNMLSSNAIEIGIEDSITGVFTSSVKQARFTGRTLSDAAGDVANERLNFIGIYDSGTNGENSAPTGYGF